MAKNQNAVALFEDQLAAMASENVKAEQSGLSATFLSTKNGVLAYRNDPISGNKLACIILAAPIERLYYSDRYDPTKVVGPKCFAISPVATGMGPASTAEAPQHTDCETCPQNQWGSSPTGGKGKACRETRRLLVLPADSITTAESVAAAEVAALRPPVTSIKNYSNYVQTIAATLKRPPLAVVTEIAVVPDAKTQFKVTFGMVKAIEDQAVIQALIKRAQDEVQRAIETVGQADDSAPAAAVAESDRF